MGLFGMMRTSVSGMQAQSNRLSAVADNIANSDTTGYKKFTTEFAQLVAPGVQSLSTSEVGSGGVLTDLRQSVSQQGTIAYTNSSTDIAISGSGFMIVADTSGSPFLTRSGSFIADGDGRLVNSANMALMGYNLENGPVSAVANGFGGLEEVSIRQFELIATPTTSGAFQANLPSEAAAITGPAPSANAATSEYTSKSSLVIVDNLGAEKIVDLYFAKTATNTWEVSVYNQADATPNAGFPYANPAMTTTTLAFDAVTGQLTAPASVTFTIPDGSATTLDLSDMSQLAANYTVYNSETNGRPPSPIKQIDIDEEGTMFARYGDGSFRALYQIPLANVISPDQLTAQTGSIFTEGQDSGAIQIGFPGDGNLGILVPGALEQSNVDLASELTMMISSQRGYTANSKVFQTGSDLLDVLVNLKR